MMGSADRDVSSDRHGVAHARAVYRNAILNSAISSSVSSMLTGFAITPFDVVSKRLQSSRASSAHGAPLQGTTHAALTVLRSGGVPALYRGLVPTLALLVPTNAVYYPLYEALRDVVEPSPLAPFVAGVCARSVVVCITSPLEYVRTFMQASPLVSALSVRCYAGRTDAGVCSPTAAASCRRRARCCVVAWAICGAASSRHCGGMCRSRRCIGCLWSTRDCA